MNHGPLPSRSARLRALAIAALAVTALPAFSQSYTNVTKLKAIAQEAKVASKLGIDQAVAWAKASNFPLNFKTKSGFTPIPSGFELGRATFVIPHSTTQASKTIGADQVWPGGLLGLSLTGLGQQQGIWEAGGVPEVTHRELVGRVFIQDGSTSISSHATGVASVAVGAGVNADVKGAAYEGRLSAYDSISHESEAALAAAGNMALSNHAYGSFGGWEFDFVQNKWYWYGDTRVSTVEDWSYGAYFGEAVRWDRICYNAPFYLPVFSAGNSRNPDYGFPMPTGAFEHYALNPTSLQFELVTADRYRQGTYDCLPDGPQCSKNTLTIGGNEALAFPYAAPSDVLAYINGSWGPTDDGRIKPEVSGVAVDVFAADNNGLYQTASGTSFSAPNVFGGLMLLNQHYKSFHGISMRASMSKLLAIHCAKEAGPNDGPDYRFGYGLFDTAAAAKQISNGAFNNVELSDYTLSNGGTISFPIAVQSGDIKVSICWTDPAGQGLTVATLDKRTPVLVNDLDLRIIRQSDGQVFRPWVLDPANPDDAATTGDNIRDIMEQVVIKGATAGTYTVQITHKGTLQSGAQIFSLAATANFLSGITDFDINPGSVVGGVESAVGTIQLGEPAKADTTLTLTSSNSQAAAVPATVEVKTGDTQVNVPITTFSVRPLPGQSEVTVNINASGTLGVRSTILRVLPVSVESIDFSSASVVGGNFVNATLVLNGPAPKNGAAIQITSDQPTVAKPIRNWVVIPAGQTSAKVRIKTNPTSDVRSVTFTTNRFGNQASNSLEVRPVSLSTLSSNSTNVVGGQSIRITISLDGLAAGSGATVALKSSNPGVISVPSSVVIPKGRRTVIVTVLTSGVLSSTPVTITASRLNVEKTVTVNVRP